MPCAAYDEIADWYEEEFLGRGVARDDDPLGIAHALRDLLGVGCGTCLDVGCGTGVNAARVRDLGWTPVGTDQGVRDKVGATHLPLAALMNTFLDAGLTLERLAEGGQPTPVVLAGRWRKRG